MGKIKRKCDNCGKEYTADTRNLKRGWGLCCCKSCAAEKREKSKPGYNPKRVAINNVRRLCWTDYRETERYPFSYDGAIAILEYMNKNIDVMESIIIKEIEMMLQLPLNERQKAYFIDLFNAANPVKIVPATDVLEDYELDYIRHVIKPKPKECYRNSHLLCEAFPERILYCEGKVNVPIPIDHAFNKVGDAYIDITFEFALHENPSIYEYVTFGEYDAKTIRKAVLETGYYGEIYKWLYYQSKK